jgi:DNA polymerase (family 10)
MTRARNRPIENAEVARLFRETADLLELGDANPFRVRAYRNAARTIEELSSPVAELAAAGVAAVDELPGIGADLAAKVVEIVETGHLTSLEELERETPAETTTLLRVPGIGPKRAARLTHALGIHSLEDLEREARAHHVAELRGFGETTERKILGALEAHRNEEHRVLRATAAQYAASIVAFLREIEGVAEVEVAGSFRRCRDTVGDLDILVVAPHGRDVVERFVGYPQRTEILARGPTRGSIRLRCGISVDLRVVPAVSFGAALHYFTGSKAHNIAVRRRGQERGLKINEYGVFRGSRRVGGRTEAEVFSAVGLPWIPPELREGSDEIEAAATGALPELLRLDEIKGDLHVHTDDSDGRSTLEEMARAAEAMGYEYIAITDHTPSVRVAGGLDRAGFRGQMRRIDRLNRTLTSLTVLKGAEVDILEDGSLDLDDETLASLDIVCVALHSHLGLPADRQTARVLRALEHRSVDVLSHPRGRMIGRRRGALLDLPRVVDAAIAHGVALEVDAQPERLDLDDRGCRLVVERRGMLAISSDAHSVDELRFMRWGVDQARRGWATAASTLNALALAKLVARLHRERGR